MSRHAVDAAAGSTVNLNVQYKQTKYAVCVPERLCKPQTADIDEVLRLVCQANPVVKAIESTLKPFTFSKGRLKNDNIDALLHDKTIVLAESGKRSESGWLLAHRVARKLTYCRWRKQGCRKLASNAIRHFVPL